MFRVKVFIAGAGKGQYLAWEHETPEEAHKQVGILRSQGFTRKRASGSVIHFMPYSIRRIEVCPIRKKAVPRA